VAGWDPLALKRTFQQLALDLMAQQRAASSSTE
jgi:hypothetical protein